MSGKDTAGVLALCAILGRVAQGSGASVAQAVQEDGIARSSGFDIVRRLELAGLVMREPGGVLLPGPTAVELGFAAYGIAPLAGPAEALLTLLRDDTDGHAALLAGDGAGTVTLLRIAARWTEGQTSQPPLVATIAPEHQVRLALTLRPETTRATRALAQAEFERCRLSLMRYLNEES